MSDHEIMFRDDMTVELVQHVGGDASVVAAAKVSVETPGPGMLADREASAGLVRYLMRHRHGTPFEHASLTFRVEAPIFVLREWHRHRVGWSYNETSGRYRHLEPVFWVPPAGRAVREPDAFKPARPLLLEDERLRAAADYPIRSAYVAAWRSYQEMLDAGVAREVARTVLPVGLYSSMFATCNPRSLMHFLSLRTRDDGAARPSYPQAEIEECARQMEAEFTRLFPLTHAAFVEFGRVAP